MDCLSKIDCFGFCKQTTNIDNQEIKNTKNAYIDDNINNKTDKDLIQQEAKNNNISFNVNAKKNKQTANDILNINDKYNNNPDHINIYINNNNNTSAEQTKINNNNNNNNTLADETSNFIDQSKRINKKKQKNKNSNNKNKEMYLISKNNHNLSDKMFNGSNTNNNKYDKQYSYMNTLEEKLKESKATDNNKKTNINNNDNKRLNINNNNNDKSSKIINELEEQVGKKGAKNKNKKENKELNKNAKFKSKNTDKNQYKGNNQLKNQPLQQSEHIQETDMHLHNFLTRIVIKICKLEELFCKNNNGDCSEFWKNLVGDDNKTFKKKDTLFTKVLNRNYNHYNIYHNNNEVLYFLDMEMFKDIDGYEPKTSEIVNQMVRQKRCKQLERLLRISNTDIKKLEENKRDYPETYTNKFLIDPMVLKIDYSPINKATEIMLMLSAIQDAAFDIYKKSNKQEKEHAKNILLFFRQVLTTLYKKDIISALDERLKWIKEKNSVKNEEERQQYWMQLFKKEQIKRQKGKEKKLINFNLNEDKKDKKEIDKIDLTQLFWRNSAKYEGIVSHHIQDEMANYQQCIDERPKFKLDDSITLDEKTKL